MVIAENLKKEKISALKNLVSYNRPIVFYTHFGF